MTGDTVTYQNISSNDLWVVTHWLHEEHLLEKRQLRGRHTLNWPFCSVLNSARLTCRVGAECIFLGTLSLFASTFTRCQSSHSLCFPVHCYITRFITAKRTAVMYTAHKRINVGPGVHTEKQHNRPCVKLNLNTLTWFGDFTTLSLLVHLLVSLV